MSGVTTGNWTRIGDNALGFGVKRFEDGDKNPLWRLQITKHHSEVVIDVDCHASDLREIIRFCERAMNDLASDGGRNAVTKAA